MPVIQSFVYKTAIIVGMLLILTSSLMGKEEQKATSIGNIGLTISNFGTFGDGFATQSPEDLPSAEYPLGSGIEHMFIGGLWVGARTSEGQVLVTTGAVDVPSFSARNTLGFEYTNTADVNDTLLVLSSNTESPFYSPLAVSHQDFIADFADTNTKIPVPEVDPNDWETIVDHNPLGLAIHLETYAWPYSYADAFVILNYNIRNIRSDHTTLTDVMVGLWADLVVRNTNITLPIGTSFFQHVASGYVDSLDLAYAYDYDGDPGFTDEGLYVGLKLLGATSDPTDDVYRFDSGFNAWLFRNNDDPLFFWPTTDVARYEKMSVDSLFIQNNILPALDLGPGNFMTLITTGPFKHILPDEDRNQNGVLDPGEDGIWVEQMDGSFKFSSEGGNNMLDDHSINITFAVIAAPKFGPDPRTEDTEESKRILYASSGLAKEFYNAGFDLGELLLPPHNFEVSWDESTVELTWDSSISNDVIGYNIYRRADAEKDPTRLNGILLTGNSYIDSSPTAGQVYYYSIKSVDAINQESISSHEIVGVPGAPISPMALIATALDGSIELQWEPNTEADISGYNVYRDGGKVNSAPVSEISYRDNLLTNFHRYWYFITAVDLDGFESFPSDSIPTFPHSNVNSLILSDGSISDPLFYLDRMTALGYSVGLWDFESEGVLFSGELNDFQSVIMSFYQTDPVIKDYLINDGNLLFSASFGQFVSQEDNLLFLGIDSLTAVRRPDGTVLSKIFKSWNVDILALIEGYPIFNLFSASIISSPKHLYPTSGAEVLYQLESMEDRYQGTPTMGVRYHNPNGSTVIALSVQLSILGPDSAIDQFLLKVMEEEFGIKTGVDQDILSDNALPMSYSLDNNYPNPFNPTTTIEFSLPKSGLTKLIIFDIMGREAERLVNSRMAVGKYKVTWDASNFASGIYFFRLRSGDFVETRKMVLLK